MLIIGGLVLGALIGAWRAKRLGGAGVDMLQYGAGHAILLGLLATVVSLVLLRA